MNFGTKSVNVEERKSLGISYGILKLKLMDFAFKKAQTSDKKQLEFFVEDDIPVGEDGYEYEKNSNYENHKFNTGISYILGEK